MKQLAKTFFLVIALSTLLTSCYTYTFNVGKGAQSNAEVRGKNHYLLFGLVPLSTSDPAKLAGGAQDYTVTVVHTFLDGFLNALTGGLYTPTTTIVKK
ncbi:MAG: Bor family protein [Cytophagales bacterium]|nr:Bor family protein [Bernardetiaceae bacterium]MDW8211733.1 Bor family protein [Cytophagales bacterium]